MDAQTDDRWTGVGLADSAPPALLTGADHVAALADAVADLARAVPMLEAWGREASRRLAAGARLLAVGNGGSAAEAQHLTAELVGRYRRERQPLAALPLHADTSTLTALGNDYPPDEVFARQVEAHGRPGDILVCLSTSGRSPNLLAAVSTARDRGLTVWALTGPASNPLADMADEAFAVASPNPPTCQEIHLAAVHVVAAAVDQELATT